MAASQATPMDTCRWSLTWKTCCRSSRWKLTSSSCLTSTVLRYQNLWKPIGWRGTSCHWDRSARTLVASMVTTWLLSCNITSRLKTTSSLSRPLQLAAPPLTFENGKSEDSSTSLVERLQMLVSICCYSMSSGASLNGRCSSFRYNGNGIAGASMHHHRPSTQTFAALHQETGSWAGWLAGSSRKLRLSSKHSSCHASVARPATGQRIDLQSYCSF